MWAAVTVGVEGSDGVVNRKGARRRMIGLKVKEKIADTLKTLSIFFSARG